MLGQRFACYILLSVVAVSTAAQDFNDLRKEIFSGRVPYPSSVASERLMATTNLRMPLSSPCDSAFCVSTHASFVDWPMELTGILASIQLHAKKSPEIIRQSSNYFLVVDAVNAEHNSYRHKLLQLALKSLLKKLDGNATVSLYITDLGAEPVLSGQSLNRDSRRRILQAAGSQGESSALVFDTALGAVASHLQQKASADIQNDHVILITNRDAREFESTTENIVDRLEELSALSVPVTAAAVGAHLNESVRQKLHSMSFSGDLFAGDESEAKKLFTKLTVPLFSPAASSGEIRLEASSGYSIQGVFGVPAAWVQQTSDRSVVVSIPTLYANLLGNGLFVALSYPDENAPEFNKSTILSVEAQFSNRPGVEAETTSAELSHIAEQPNKTFSIATLLVSQHLYLTEALNKFYDEKRVAVAANTLGVLSAYNRPLYKKKWSKKYEMEIRAVNILALRLNSLAKSLTGNKTNGFDDIQGTWVVELVKNRYLIKTFGRDEYVHISPDGRLAVSTSEDPLDTSSFKILRDFYLKGNKLVSLGYYRQDFVIQREGEILRLQEPRICSTQDGRCDAVFRFHREIPDEFFLSGYGSLGN